MKSEVLLTTDFPFLKLFLRGKVRDIYDLGANLLIVATDRISAFDSVLANGIPDKGKVLNLLSGFWFEKTSAVITNHLISCRWEDFPTELKGWPVLKDRSMLVKRTEGMAIECVVRGYLAGSGWKEYREKGSISDIGLPPGLKEAERLPEPIFTPATKSRSGHDENIDQRKVEDKIGKEMATFLQDKSLEIYSFARHILEEKGIILSDTKFEFGILDGEVILIDELLTPDSSRFWPADTYRPGRPQRSLDKQFVRDYLESSGWDKSPPAPSLPEEVVMKTREKYLQVYQRITGEDLV